MTLLQAKNRIGAQVEHVDPGRPKDRPRRGWIGAVCNNRVYVVFDGEYFSRPILAHQLTFLPTTGGTIT